MEVPLYFPFAQPQPQSKKKTLKNYVGEKLKSFALGTSTKPSLQKKIGIFAIDWSHLTMLETLQQQSSNRYFVVEVDGKKMIFFVSSQGFHLIDGQVSQ